MMADEGGSDSEANSETNELEEDFVALGDLDDDDANNNDDSDTATVGCCTTGS